MAEQWDMFAHRHDAGLWNVGSRAFVDAHGLRDPIVAVTVVEVPDDDPAGTHWGWIASGHDKPSMIWPNRACFDVCFPYGAEAEEKAGRGRAVRLAVTEVAGT